MLKRTQVEEEFENSQEEPSPAELTSAQAPKFREKLFCTEKRPLSAPSTAGLLLIENHYLTPAAKQLTPSPRGGVYPGFSFSLSRTLRMAWARLFLSMGFIKKSATPMDAICPEVMVSLKPVHRTIGISGRISFIFRAS